METAPTQVGFETYWQARLDTLEHDVGKAWICSEPTLIVSVPTLQECLNRIELLGFCGVDYEAQKAEHTVLNTRSALVRERCGQIGYLLEQAADLTADIVESEAFESIDELDKTNLKDIDEVLPAFAAAHQWDYCPDCAFGDECLEFSSSQTYCLLEIEDRGLISDSLAPHCQLLRQALAETSGDDELAVPAEALWHSLQVLKDNNYYINWLTGNISPETIETSLLCWEDAIEGHEYTLDMKQDLLKTVHELVKPLIESPDLVERLVIDAAALHTWFTSITALSKSAIS